MHQVSGEEPKGLYGTGSLCCSQQQLNALCACKLLVTHKGGEQGKRVWALKELGAGRLERESLLS